MVSYSQIPWVRDLDRACDTACVCSAMHGASPGKTWRPGERLGHQSDIGTQPLWGVSLMAYLASSHQGGRVPKEHVKLGYSPTRYKKASQTPPPSERLSMSVCLGDTVQRSLGTRSPQPQNALPRFSSLFEISFLTFVWALPLLTA